MNVRTFLVLVTAALSAASCNSEPGEEGNNGRVVEDGGDVSSADAGDDAADTADASEASSPQVCREELDGDGDGEADYITIYEYNDDGTLAKETMTEIDGPLMTVESYSYDSQGRVSSVGISADGDDVADDEENYTYSPLEDGGYRAVVDYDRGIDATVDERTVYEYDADDNMLRYEVDEDFDGTIDSVARATYDADGKRETFEVDLDADGTFDLVSTSIYGEDGKLVRVETDEGGDAAPERTVRYLYEDGVLVGYVIELDNNGDTLSYGAELFYDC